MTDNVWDFDQIADAASQLSPLERVRLVQQVMATLNADMADTEKPPYPTLYGLWAGNHVSEQDIDDLRRELWAAFPREDI